MEWLKKEFPRVASLEEQITEEQLSKLISEFGKDELKNKLADMENYKKITGYTSVYLTVLKWLKKDRK